MSFSLNLIIIMVIFFFLAVFFFIKVIERKDKVKLKKAENNKEDYSLPFIIEHVKNMLNQITNTNLYDLGLSQEEFLKRHRKRNELNEALKNCNSGNVNDKVYVKDFIKDLLIKTYHFNEENVNYTIPFESPEKLSIRDKFDILLHHYQKKHGYKALAELISKYRLDETKTINEEEHFIITKEEINAIFKKEYSSLPLDFNDKMQIITQRVYSCFKGYGVIDDLRDMSIDGISGGVSGLPKNIQNIEQEVDLFQKIKSRPQNVDSVWIMYRGKTIHLSFLSFETEAELRRVAQTIYKYNNPGQLSESRPYIVNEMADGSRVVVVRPPFSESWAFFVRKFDLPSATLPALITDENAELAIDTLKFLMYGCRITALTGSQGSGKTSLLMSLVKYIHPSHTLRIQEMAFELNLRKIYPERNILSFQETDHVSGQSGLDLQKKTDGSVNILGEVASDPVAAWMIQMSQVASLFTVFTHHAKTFKDLIESLRNSLLKAGMFSNESIAEQQVVNVINFDIHLKRDSSGRRYIERITECIPLNDQEEYPMEWKSVESTNDKMDAFMDTVTEYFRRKTDRKTFTGRNIIEYREGKYHAVSPFSDRQKKEILDHLNEEQSEEFLQFINKYWGN